MSGYFITGTDTGIGKTVITLGLMKACRDRGCCVLGMKPVASACESTPDGLRNSDALQIQQACSGLLPYETVNPFAFEPPIAPHIAAEQAGLIIDINRIASIGRELFSKSDVLFIEGVGGWEVPLGESAGVPEMAQALALPVILVVGVRLGCINHALLSVSAIRDSGLELAGWVANRVERAVDAEDEIISTLKSRIDAPLLGCIPWIEGCSADDVATRLNADFCCP